MAYEVVVRRANGAAWWLRSFRVDIDGRAVGRVRPGRVLSTEVAAGRHRVQVFVGSNSSNPVDFDAVDDDHLALFVRPADLKLAPANRITTARQWHELSSARGVDPLALVADDSDRGSGATLRDVLRARPPSFLNPARTPTQRLIRTIGLLLALAGFIVLGVAHSVIGMVLLVPPLAIFIWQAVALLHATRRAKRTRAEITRRIEGRNVPQP